MTLKWNHREYQFNDRLDMKSFPEHREHMRDFRQSHTVVTMVNAPKRNELAFLESMPHLRLSHAIETGGSRLPSGSNDWSGLTPVARVTTYKLPQN